MDEKRSENVKTLVEELNKAYQEFSLSKKTRKFEVSEATTFLSAIYEKVRNTVDFKDEHLIKRFAIQRFLRVYLSSKSNKEEASELLIRDLLRGKYINDSQVTDTKYQRISGVVDKYISSKKLLNELRLSADQGGLWDFLLGIASTEIEKIIDPMYRPEVFIKLMTQYVLRTLRDSSFDLSPEQESLQVFLACHKSLVRSDFVILRYHAMTLMYPDYFNNPSSEAIKSVVSNLSNTKNYIDGIIKSRTQEQLYMQVRRLAAPFKVLEGVLEAYPEQVENILKDDVQLRIRCEEYIQSYYSDLKKKLNLRISRTLIYLFITKMLLAILIEAPVDLYFLKHINYATLAVNTFFPITLFYFIARRIRIPGQENNEKIFSVVRNIVYNDKYFLSEEEELQFKKRLVMYKTAKHWLSYAYAILYILVYGLIFYTLDKIGFNFTSIVIFIFFVSVLSFFAWNIRARCADLQMVAKKEGLLESILNIASLPILKVGQRLSVEVARFNFFTLIFDFILEAPFKLIVQSFEDIIDFMKSKHEEVVQN